MKQTVSAPLATPTAKPEITQAAREANGAGSSLNGGPPSPKASRVQSLSRFARAREISLGVKLIVLAVAVVFVISTSGGWSWMKSLTTNRTDILPAPVKKGKLAITVKERGMLESAENNDV